MVPGYKKSFHQVIIRIALEVEFRVLYVQVLGTVVAVPLPVGGRERGVPSAIRIHAAAQCDIDIIVKHLVIPEAFESQTKVFIGRKLWRQESGMPAAAHWKIAEGQVQGHGHAFEFGMRGTRYRYLVIDDLD